MVRETVKLISAEGFEFLVDYKAACVSATVKNMLSSQGTSLQYAVETPVQDDSGQSMLCDSVVCLAL